MRCTDYQGTINGYDYDENECNGWIRDWVFYDISFGTDQGIDYSVTVGSGESLCRDELDGSSSDGYSLDYSDKRAFYTSGQTITIIHPAKNHANYDCFNYVPDTEMKLYMNPNVNPNSELSNNGTSMTDNGYILVRDWHDNCTPGTDGCGFQNCPGFDCDDTDKAVCIQSFTVPTVSQSGYYTFVWYWIFNPGQLYTSCWEGYIQSSSSSSPSISISPTASPVIGVTPSPSMTSSPTSSTTTTTESASLDGSISITNHYATQDYYLRIKLENVDATSCYDSINKTQLFENNLWRDNDQIDYGNEYGYYYNGIQFSELLPISIKIIMNSKRVIFLNDTITDLVPQNTFTSSQFIC